MIISNQFKLLFITIAFNLYYCLSYSQSIGRNLSIDTWGNIYRWTESEVEKFDPNQKLYFRTGNLSFGKISKVDLVQPQKPFLFFEDTQRIVFLDNTLSEQGQDLSLANLAPSSWITNVSGSIQGGFWCFDNMNNRIIRLDRNGSFLFSIDNLYRFNPLSDWDVIGFLEQKNSLYIWDHHHLFVFDLLGDLTMTYPYKKASFMIDGENIYSFNNDEILLIFPFQKRVSIPIISDHFTISKDEIIIWDSTIERLPLE